MAPQIFLPHNSGTYVSVTPTPCSKPFHKFIFLSSFKVAAGATEVAVFGSASETFSKKNINCSIDESMLRFEEVINTARERQIPVRGLVLFVLLSLAYNEWKHKSHILLAVVCYLDLLRSK